MSTCTTIQPATPQNSLIDGFIIRCGPNRGSSEGGNGADGDSDGSGGGSSGGSSDGSDDGGGGWTPPAWLVSNLGVLKSFLTSPLQFIRGRIIPVILGGLFGFVFDIASLIAQPFDAIETGLSTLSQSISNTLGSLYFAVLGLLNVPLSWLSAATSGLGVLQPWIVAAFSIGASYVVIIATVRLARSVADSIPVASSIETFLFG